MSALPEAAALESTSTVGAALRIATARLAAFSDSPRLDAELLLCALLGCNRAQLIAHAGRELDAAQAGLFAKAVARRAEGEPVAYLLGEKEFWSLRLRVTPAVLVPRPETELLVEWALSLLVQVPTPRIADLGTGSGAIALALAHERADARVIAIDASADALEVARANAGALGLARVAFRLGDWFAPLAGERFDLLVSNPPYIAEGDPHLAALRCEPRRALVAADDGLAALRVLVDGASAHLCNHGWLLLEHGAGQGAAVRALFAACGFERIETRHDLAGHERATGARKPGL